MSTEKTGRRRPAWDPSAEDVANARRSLDKSGVSDRDQAMYYAVGYIDSALQHAADDALLRDSSIRRARALLAALKDWKPGGGSGA